MVLTAAAEPAAEPSGVAGLAVDAMDTLGGSGAALLVGLDNVFPPVPSELVLPLAGFAASQGTHEPVRRVPVDHRSARSPARCSSTCSARGSGRDRVRALIIRVPLMKAADFDRTERWFQRHGTKAVFFGRMVPLFRSLISLPAGWSACRCGSSCPDRGRQPDLEHRPRRRRLPARRELAGGRPVRGLVPVRRPGR